MPSQSLPQTPKVLSIVLGGLACLFFLAGFLTSRPKANARPSPDSPKKQNVEITADTKEGAQRLKKEYERQGFRVSVSSIKRPIQIPSGFIVAQELGPDVAESVKNALSQVYHYKVTLRRISIHKVQVQIGNIYATEAEAQPLASRLQAMGYQWRIQKNLKTVYKNKYLITVKK